MNKKILEGFIRDGFSTYDIARAIGKSNTSIRYWLEKFDLYDLYRSSRPNRYKDVSLVCEKHGVEKVRYSGSLRCKKCAAEAVSNRRRELKRLAVEYLGGCCSVCGYDKCVEALEFHHKDPTKKDFGISKEGRTRSWEKTREEVDKCLLVCSNCHREIHAELIGELP